MTPEQRAILEDKLQLWRKFSTEGAMDMRDYHRRCAEALEAALALPASPNRMEAERG